MAILKFFHVLFIFIWIGSLLILTRLLGYQAKESDEIFQAMNRINKRIYFFVDLPSMILAVLFGLLLLFLKDLNWKAPWLHMKLLFAFLLIVCDIICGTLIAKGGRRPRLFYQIFHGITGIFLILVLIAIYILKQNAC
ncbi:MAG: CopD family protein [Chlamydiales bacterium]|nr:CopD family protein [Chlamydiales bacterium]